MLLPFVTKDKRNIPTFFDAIHARVLFELIYFIYLLITCNWVDTLWQGVITCYISTDYEDFTLKFRYGGLHEKHVVATWNCREPSQHLLKDPGKPGKAWDDIRRPHIKITPKKYNTEVHLCQKIFNWKNFSRFNHTVLKIQHNSICHTKNKETKFFPLRKRISLSINLYYLI